MIFRDAEAGDIPAIVRMYADDDLGQTREAVADPLPEEYSRAFEQIDADPRQRLVVVEDHDGVVATVQLTFLPHLVLRGGERAQIEGVRVRSDRRGSGLGEIVIRWAVGEARSRRCRLVQLTTSASRQDARRFYEGLGFQASHIGMKMTLDEDEPTPGQ